MDYKQEIQNTRKGCLGSSDANMIANISSLGFVPKSALKRLAICKGLIKHDEIPRTAAINAGDEIERLIYEHLSKNNPNYQSNPLWKSDIYSKKNVALISHPDIVLQDKEKKTLFVYEVKTTKFDVDDTKRTYKAQLYIHNLIAKEKAASMKGRWKVRVFLVHYSTKGLNLDDGVYFEPERLSLHECKFKTKVFDVEYAMNIINEFLETFDYYTEGEEIDANLLPEKIFKGFSQVTERLKEIQHHQKVVESFKEQIYQFMLNKGIKVIKNEDFCITRVDEATSKSFDYKRYLDDFAKEHPYKANKIRRQYEKVTTRKGYATIKIKTKEQ